MKLPFTRGERTYTTLPITTLASGLQLELPVHIVAGARPGPTLGLTAATHGDAISGPKWIKAVLDSLDLAQLSGTVVAVPLGNPPGFEWQRRNTPIDGVNMNRVYPGDASGRLTDQMASALGQLIRDLDAVIDCHGDPCVSINYMYARPTGRRAYDDRVFALAVAFGMEYLWDGLFYSGSLTHLASTYDIPGLVLELALVEPGGDAQLHAAVRGVLGVLRELGMWAGELLPPRTQWLLRERTLIRPHNGGLFLPELPPESLNAVVKGGSVLGRVIDPSRLEEIETITAPYAETVILQARHTISRVHPGDYAYIVADRANATRLSSSTPVD